MVRRYEDAKQLFIFFKNVIWTEKNYTNILFILFSWYVQSVHIYYKFITKHLIMFVLDILNDFIMGASVAADKWIRINKQNINYIIKHIIFY